MKFLLPFAIIIAMNICIYVNSYSQCTNCNNNYPSGTFSTTSSTPTTVSTCMYGGEYAYFSVTSGQTYNWQTCGDSDFDTQLSLFQTNCGGTSLSYNDDGCSLQSSITWTATFTGTVAVLVSEYNCINNSTCMTLQWSCTSCGGGATTAGDCAVAVNVCTDLGFQIDANGYGSIDEIPALGSLGNPDNNNPGGSGNWGCLRVGELNSTWMIINIGTDGELEFNFGGSSQAGYYDWIMYPYNANSCTDIPANLVAPVRCNWNAVSSGGTGCADPVPAGGDAGNFEPPLPVLCGEQYIICFSNYSSVITDVPLSFFGTASVSCLELTCAGSANCNLTPVTGPEQDCPNAIPVCQDYYCQENTYTGTGSIPNEINSSISCLASGEKNDVWYILSVQQSGNLYFDITPNDLANDYDWAVFNLSSANCSDIYNNLALQVSCNYSATGGVTGANGGSSNTVQSASGTPHNAVIPVTAGQTYVLNVSNYSSSNSGYELDFSNSTAEIYDNVPPALQSLTATPSCGATQISFNFSEYILCSSIQNCDFTLIGPLGESYTLSGVTGAGCTTGSQENTFTINISPAILSSGTYSFNLVTGCSFVQDLCGNVAGPGTLTFTINPITITTSSSNVSCYGACNGTATVTIVNGTPVFDIYWTNTTGYTNTTMNTATSDNTITNICAGNYTVSVVDNLGCATSQANINVTEPAQMTASLTSTAANCGLSDGTVTITVTNGASPWDYQLSPGTTIFNQLSPYTFNNLAIGAYSVTVTDNVGCTATGTISVGGGGTVSAGFTYNGNQCDKPDPPGNTVSFTNTSTGATSYSWNFGDSQTSTLTNPTHTYTNPGAYNVQLTATDAGCSDVEVIAVTIYNLPVLTFTVTNVNCNGYCNGSIQAVPAAGGPYGSSVFPGWIWSNGGNTQTISNLCPGTYTVTVTDNLGCSGTGSATITQPTAITVSVASTNATCNGVCNGTAQVVTVSGGIGPFGYLWSTGETTQSISNLCPGTYYVTTTDIGAGAPACTNVQSVSITQPPAITLTTTTTNSSCGSSDGSACVTPSGGTPPYTYDWSNDGPENPDNDLSCISAVGAGPYTVTVTDGLSCTAVISVNVVDNSGPSSSVTASQNLNCYGVCIGSFTVQVSGGTTPYTYNWDNGASTTTTSSITQTYSNLCAGIHTVDISDNGGCGTSESVTLTEPPQLTVTVVGTPANCSTPGSATAFPNGGVPNYTFLWTGGATGGTANNLAAGIYCVTVTDANLCTVFACVTITDIGGVTATIISTTGVSCYGSCNGTATVQVNNGTPNYTYNWSNGFSTTSASSTNTAIGLCAGPISVAISDNNGCGAVASGVIPTPSQVSVTVTGQTNPTCNGSCNGTATVTATGGTPGYTYQWSFGTGSQTTNPAINLCAGTYSVTVYDAYGCTSIASVTLIEPPAMSATATATTAYCNQSNGSATVTNVTGGNPGSPSYQWSAGSPSNQQTVNSLPPGPVTVSVYDALDCSTTVSLTVPNTPGGTATIVNVSHVTCNGLTNGSASVSYSGTIQSILWAPFANTQTITGLSAGLYSVTVTDTNNCTSTASVTINQPAPLILSIQPTDPDCYGDYGSIVATASGGTSPYACQWNIPSNNCTPSVLAGTYCVTITDYNSCTVANCGTVNQPAQVTIVETIVNASCGQSDGSISVSVSGGAVPYTYQWNTGGSTNSLVDIPTGTYVLTVKDAKNCSVTEAYIVNNISGPVLQIDSVHHILCYGDNTGEAFASATGGQGTLTYSWSDLLGQNAPVATNLLAGTYYVTVKDTNQCADIDSVIILQPAQALGFFLNTDEPQCFGESNGSATVIPYGGTPPYNFLWSGGCTPSGNQCLNLNAGFYSIQVTDTNGCVLVQNFTLGQPTQIILLVDHTDASCSGTGDGTAFVDTVYGGTPDPVLGYTYLWSDNQMTNPALNLDPGLYCVTVFDDYYCTQSACVTVGSPSTLTFQNININNVDCYGNSTGSVTVIATGGSPGQSGYNYYWEDNAGNFIGNSPSLSNLSQGVYYLTISDLNSCSINTTIIINQPPPLLVNVPDDSVSCFSDCDGSLIAEVIGGQSPYYIIWSTLVSDTLIPYAPGVPINDTIINLCAGQYSVTVIDDADCSVSDNTLLYEPPLLQVANVVTTDATCGYNDGCAEIIFNGGTVGFIFMWSDSIGNSAYECGLAAGNYSVTVMDNNGCTTYTNVDVNNLNGPQIVLPVPVTDISCYGLSDGSAYVLFNESNPPAGPYDIYWYNNESIQIGQGASVNGMSEGTYSVNVIDTNNCLAVATFQVDQPNTLQSLITSVPATCFDFCNGSAYVISVGGTMPYYYLWSNGGTNIQATGLCAGYVDVIVTDDNGCTSQSATVIGQPQQLNMLVTVHDVTCYGFHNGSISIIPSGGSGAYNYQWCNGGTSNMAGQLSAGTCCMILYDQTNPQCNIDSCFTLTQPDLIVPYVTTTETTCNSCNGTATITDIEGGSGLFNATWSPPNTVPTATGLCYGTSYLLLVTDQLDNNCSVTQFVAVGRIPPPVVLSVEYDNPSCYGLPDGNALVRVKDGTPVYYYEWALITQGIPNIIVAGPNDSIAMNIPGGYYNVTITDADGCTTFTSFTLTQPNPINVFGHGTGYICHGQTTVISATASGGTPPYDYFWTNNITTQSQIVSPAISTMYMVTVVDVNGCQSQTPAVVSISVRPQLQTTIFAVDTSVCEGQSVNMLANTIYSYGQVYYLWSNGGTDSTITVSPLENTTFYLTVYDECGMPATDDKGVTVHPAPIIDVIADILEGCQPLLVNFSNAVEQDFITYLWNFGDATSGSANSSYLQSPSHTYLQPGTYNVTLQVTDQQYNCTNEFVYENLIAVYAIPEASFIPSPNPTSLFNAEIQFINQTVGGSIWIWDFGDASYSFEQHPVHTYESADTFIVMLDARTPQGCRDTALVNVYINPEFTFYAPTAFTPKHEQGLGENDYFTPKGNGIADCDGCYHLYIYDRWGELIFETDEFYGNNPADKNRWNGKVKNKGRPVEVGVYKWLVKVIDITGLEHEYSGNVTVIR